MGQWKMHNDIYADQVVDSRRCTAPFGYKGAIYMRFYVPFAWIYGYSFIGRRYSSGTGELVGFFSFEGLPISTDPEGWYLIKAVGVDDRLLNDDPTYASRWTITWEIHTQSVSGPGGTWDHRLGTAGRYTNQPFPIGGGGSMEGGSCEPIPESIHVYLNGVEQYEPTDWDLSPALGSELPWRIVVRDPMDIEQGDLLEFRYACKPGVASVNPDFSDDFNRSNRVLNGDNGWYKNGSNNPPENPGFQIVGNQVLPTTPASSGWYSSILHAAGPGAGYMAVTGYSPNLFYCPLQIIARGVGFVVDSGNYKVHANNTTYIIKSHTMNSFGARFLIAWEGREMRFYLDGGLFYVLALAADVEQLALSVGFDTFGDSRVAGTPHFDNFVYDQT